MAAFTTNPVWATNGASYQQPVNGHSQSGLGEEEEGHHRALLALQAEVRSTVSGLASINSSKSQLQLLERQIQDRMAQMRAHIRDLELLAEEQDTDEQTQAVEVILRQHKAEYEVLRASITAAKMAAKEAAERQYAQLRRELLSGAAVPSLLRRAENEGQLVQGASDITDSLRRTRQALAQTLEQAAGSLAVVDTGNKVLQETKTELTGQQELFKESKASLNTLKRQSSGDRRLLWLGLTIFLLAAAYVGYKRAPPVVRGPLDAVLRVTGRTAWSVTKTTGKAAYWAGQQAYRQIAKSRSKGSTITLGHDPGIGGIEEIGSYFDPVKHDSHSRDFDPGDPGTWGETDSMSDSSSFHPADHSADHLHGSHDLHGRHDLGHQHEHHRQPEDVYDPGSVGHHGHEGSRAHQHSSAEATEQPDLVVSIPLQPDGAPQVVKPPVDGLAEGLAGMPSMDPTTMTQSVTSGAQGSVTADGVHVAGAGFATSQQANDSLYEPRVLHVEQGEFDQLHQSQFDHQQHQGQFDQHDYPHGGVDSQGEAQLSVQDHAEEQAAAAGDSEHQEQQPQAEHSETPDSKATHSHAVPDLHDSHTEADSHTPPRHTDQQEEHQSAESAPEQQQQQEPEGSKSGVAPSTEHHSEDQPAGAEHQSHGADASQTGTTAGAGSYQTGGVASNRFQPDNTPENRAAFAWLFLEDEDLVPWLADNISPEYAGGWLPSSGLDPQRAAALWPRALRLLQRRHHEQERGEGEGEQQEHAPDHTPGHEQEQHQQEYGHGQAEGAQQEHLQEYGCEHWQHGQEQHEYGHEHQQEHEEGTQQPAHRDGSVQDSREQAGAEELQQEHEGAQVNDGEGEQQQQQQQASQGDTPGPPGDDAPAGPEEADSQAEAAAEQLLPPSEQVLAGVVESHRHPQGEVHTTPDAAPILEPPPAHRGTAHVLGVISAEEAVPSGTQKSEGQAGAQEVTLGSTQATGGTAEGVQPQAMPGQEAGAGALEADGLHQAEEHLHHHEAEQHQAHGGDYQHHQFDQYQFDNQHHADYQHHHFDQHQYQEQQLQQEVEQGGDGASTGAESSTTGSPDHSGTVAEDSTKGSTEDSTTGGTHDATPDSLDAQDLSDLAEAAALGLGMAGQGNSAPPPPAPSGDTTESQAGTNEQQQEPVYAGEHDGSHLRSHSHDTHQHPGSSHAQHVDPEAADQQQQQQLEEQQQSGEQQQEHDPYQAHYHHHHESEYQHPEQHGYHHDHESQQQQQQEQHHDNHHQQQDLQQQEVSEPGAGSSHSAAAGSGRAEGEPQDWEYAYEIDGKWVPASELGTLDPETREWVQHSSNDGNGSASAADGSLHQTQSEELEVGGDAAQAA